MAVVEQGSSLLEVQETGQEQETQPPTSPQYEDVTQESDLESVASFSASQSKKQVFLDFGAGRRSHRRLHEQLLVSFFWHPT